MKKILIAGIGNIFYGDDAFGCEVIHQLLRSDLPEEVTAIDYGIRSYDLVYALTDGYDAVILVDAIPNQGKPGVVYLIEPDLARLDEMNRATVDAHGLNPLAVLQMAQN